MLTDSFPAGGKKEPDKMSYKTGKGAVCQQYVRCGKPNCKCARGELHGPYYILYWHDHGKRRIKYVRLDDAEKVAKACKARRLKEKKAREEAKRAKILWSLLSQRLRAMMR